MVNYFKYTRKQRRMAVTLLFNALLAFAMYVAASHYLPQFDQSAATEIFTILDIAIWIIEALLIGVAAYFWIENKSIELWVTPKELHYFDPTFTDCGWTLAINDIVELEQYTDIQSNFTNTNVVLKSGERKQLTFGNFSIDRRAFFAALKKANPQIKLPDNPYLYGIRRPQWALNWLKRNK
tara:strand:- start:645 stop:1187 length:543 start_codon:yes stop_codon:yes gene_type:complete